MDEIIDVVARKLGIPRDKLEREAIELWLRHKLILMK